jgi:hypothetical protein
MANISDHSNPMHRGPHHDKYIHDDNRLQVKMSQHGEHPLGDKNHIKSVMGEPKGADVEGHKGTMHW